MLATLPVVMAGSSVAVWHVTGWAAAMAVLGAAALSRRLDDVVTRFGPYVFVLLVLWLVSLTGGTASPYAALYMLGAGFMAVFRETRAFVGATLAALVAFLVPGLLDGAPDALVGDAVSAGVLVTTLGLTHRAALTSREASGLYLSLLERHSGPSYVVGPEGTMLWINDHASRLLGMSEDEVVGMPWAELVAEGEFERLTPVLQAAMNGDPQAFTVRVEAPGGRYRLRGTALPLFQNGRVQAVMGITEDVTDLHEALFTGQALIRTVDALSVPIAIFDEETTETLYANAAAWTLAEQVPADAPTAERFGWSDLPAELRDVPRSPGRPVVVTTDLGAGRQFDVSLEVIEEDLDVIVCTAVDTTQRAERERGLNNVLEAEREAGERLRELDRLKNAFLTAVSHELRTPLTVVVGAAKTLQRLGDTQTPETRRRLEAALANHADRLSGLLADLLDVDRLTRGTLQACRMSFDVAELVVRIGKELTADDPDRLTLVAPPTLDVLADPVQVERIITNLLTNANKYAPATAIEITLDPRPDNGFRLVVADHGPGVPASERERIFEPFYRLDLGHPQPGTGVGLALVAEFAALHGGTARADETPGGGTRITVDIAGLSAMEGALAVAG